MGLLRTHLTLLLCHFNWAVPTKVAVSKTNTGGCKAFKLQHVATRYRPFPQRDSRRACHSHWNQCEFAPSICNHNLVSFQQFRSSSHDSKSVSHGIHSQPFTALVSSLQLLNPHSSHPHFSLPFSHAGDYGDQRRSKVGWWHHSKCWDQG